MLNIDNLINDLQPFDLHVSTFEDNGCYFIKITHSITSKKLKWQYYWGSFDKFCHFFITKYFKYKSYELTDNYIIFEIGSVLDILSNPDILSQNTVNHTR